MANERVAPVVDRERLEASGTEDLARSADTGRVINRKIQASELARELRTRRKK